MTLKFLCPFWGSEDLGFDHFLDRVIADGYDGVELYLNYKEPDKALEMIRKLKNRELCYVVQHGQSSNSTFPDYKDEYRRSLIFLASTSPLFINAQTGVDHFSFEQNQELIELADRIQEETGTAIKHEIHRGKFGFAAHITAKFLDQIPNLRLTADFSHWVNVAESMLEDQQESMALAIARSDHIHARIGFPEGPQIPDPRAPEWKDTIGFFLGWWDKIIKRAGTEKRSYFTITPEFGPFPYMTVMPLTGQPISSQWEINVYMKDLLKRRYEHLAQH